MWLTASTVTVPSWILQIKPSPSLLQGSKVELHPLAHAQFASLHSVQRLSPKKGASDKNSHPGFGAMALCARNAHAITVYDVTTWSFVNLDLVNPVKP